MDFIDWEGRPAVIVGVEALAVVDRAVGWEPVQWAEVVDSGGVVSEEVFRARFPWVPPLPEAFARSTQDDPTPFEAAAERRLKAEKDG